MIAAEKIAKQPVVPFAAIVDRAEFIPALARVVLAIERRTTIPILSCVLIEAIDAEHLRLRATNLDHEIEVTIAAKNAAGRTALPGHSLLRMVKGMWESEIALRLAPSNEKNGERIAVECGPVKARLVPYAVEDYPDFKTRERAGVVTLPEGSLHWLLSGVLHAISTEETRYYLNGIYLQFRENRLSAVATDGHRLACREVAPAALIAGEQPGIIIPRGVVQSLLWLARRSEVTIEAFRPEPGWAVSHMRFSAGDFTIRTKLIDGTYPDWQRVVPANRGGYMRIARRDLLRALKVVPKHERARSVKFTIDAEGGLQLDYSHPDFGAIEQAIEATPFGQEMMQVGVNAEYFASMISALTLAGTDHVRLHFISSDAPLVITADSEVEHEFALCMPMRL